MLSRAVTTRTATVRAASSRTDRSGTPLLLQAASGDCGGGEGAGNQDELDHQGEPVAGQPQLLDGGQVAQRVQGAGDDQGEYRGHGEGGEPVQRARFDGSAECDEGDQAADPESGGERVERVDAEVDRARRGCVPGRGNGHRGSQPPRPA